MMNLIFDKTGKGREEMATRKHGLSLKMRSLLVLIDGKNSGEDLVKKFSYLGLNDQNLAKLLEEGFVQSVQPAPAATPAAQAAKPVAEQHKQPAAEEILAEGETQFHAIYNFYTHTITSTLGLRGYGLQLKVERASSIEDFRALRTKYLEAVFKAKGDEMTRSLRNRLDQLLYLGEPVPPNTNPVDASS
ncbi:MAG: hypothetical protein JWQ21_758 [Herminiimonas sp.]|nr:hypothetical protein [Herminiimonas sp.]